MISSETMRWTEKETLCYLTGIFYMASIGGLTPALCQQHYELIVERFQSENTEKKDV